MEPELRKLLDAGVSLRAIARKLNEEGTLTASGKKGAWTATAIRNIVTPR
jgi:hypothetical protein